MGLPIMQNQENPERKERIVRLETSYFRPEFETRGPLKVEFRKVLYCLPFLFLSGVLAGIGIMLI